jgi:ribosomal protein S6E (S10)
MRETEQQNGRSTSADTIMPVRMSLLLNLRPTFARKRKGAVTRKKGIRISRKEREKA